VCLAVVPRALPETATQRLERLDVRTIAVQMKQPGKGSLFGAYALAGDRHGQRAGMASATLGSGQYVIAALASAAVGLANDGTMRPMAIEMAVCAVGASVAAALGRRAPPDAMLTGDGEAPAHRAT